MNLSFFNIIFIFITLPLLLCSTHSVQGQTNRDPKPCRADELMDNRLLNTSLELDQWKYFSEIIPLADGDKAYTVPVVFHVFGTVYNFNTTVTEEIVADALHRTNEDFKGLNEDYNSIDAPFDVIKKPLDITFKLAKLDPNGNPTSGVIFYDEAGGMGNGDDPLAVKLAWDNYKYCNIFITRDLYANGNYFNSGVAFYPSEYYSDNNGARIVYNGSYLGTNTNENFRSTLTHEFGHWLDLRHTFSYSEDGDGIADTPYHRRSSTGTECQKIYNYLNEEINNENFMDYTDCYKMFTAGQVARMINALEQSPARNTLWIDKNLSATGVNEDLGSHIIASQNYFEEERLNEGGIDNNVVKITCKGCFFTRSSGDYQNGSDYMVDNLPEGLTASVSAIDDDNAQILISGKAVSHGMTDSNDLVFRVLNPMVREESNMLYNSGTITFSMDFIDPYTSHSHCLPNRRYGFSIYIAGISFDGQTILSDDALFGNTNYRDNISFPVKKGDTYPISITTNRERGDNSVSGSDTQLLRIQGWFDWNNNFVYEDSELVISHIYDNTYDSTLTNNQWEHTYSTSVTIPQEVDSNHIAFRILTHFVRNNEGDDACSAIYIGESEDYGLTVVENPTELNVVVGSSLRRTTPSQPVQFVNLSYLPEGDTIKSYYWTFEGGVPTISNERNPTIYFTELGSHDVSLEVTSTNGLTQSVTYPEYITSRIKYCRPHLRFGGHFNVTHLVIGDVWDGDVPTSRVTDLYTGDDVSFSLEQGKTYPITFSTVRGTNIADADVNRVRVWADWNGDSEYSDSELIVSSKFIQFEDHHGENDEFVFTDSFVVPLNAKTGTNIGFRVMGHYVDGQGGETACYRIRRGNVIDYALRIEEGDGSVPLIADVAPVPNTHPLTEPLQYTDRSSGLHPITSWTWTFQGGEPATHEGQNPPPVRYESAGRHEYSLTVTDQKGNTDTYTNYITFQNNYCRPFISYGSHFNVTHLVIGDVWDGDVPTSRVTDLYTRHDVSFSLEQGKTYPITFSTVRGIHLADADVNRVRVWADWNGDSEFSDNELIVSKLVRYTDYDENDIFIFTESLVVPLNARTGTKIGFRVMGHYVDGQGGETACYRIRRGSVIDYALRIEEGDGSVPLIADVAPVPNTHPLTEPLQYTDRSSGLHPITSWTWTFQGGEPATHEGQNPPPVRYESAGRHEYSLTVTDQKGNTDTYTNYITSQITYCNLNVSFGGYFNITHLVIGDVWDGDVPTSRVTDLYTGYGVFFSLEQGKTYPITFSTVRGIYLADADVNRVRVWADWNGDSEFSDNELIVSKLVRYTDYDENDVFIFTDSLVVPLNAKTGTNIGFRVMGHYVDDQGEGETACDAIDRGNVIDYALRIEEGDGSVPLIADVAPVPNTHPLTEPLQYTDRSSGLHPITSWTWTFQGGEPATHEGQNPPPVRYESAGRHEYSLTVTDQEGNTDTYTNYITSQITYCNLNVSFGGYFNVTHLVIGDVWDGDVPTSRVTDLYTGYGVFFSLEQGKTYPITFSTVRGIYLADADVNRVRVWADWNGDSEFSDNELIVSKLVRYTDYDENDVFIFTDSLVVPLNVKTGTNIGFRVMGHYVDDQGEGETACDAIDRGNVIDYALRIEEGDGSVPLIADVAPVPNTHPLTEPLQYTDRSSGLHPITSWTWTFQGGEPATHEGQNPPPVRYESVGRHEYSLTVTDQKGNTDTYTNYITFQNNYCRPFISYGSHFNVTHLVIGDVWDGDVPTSRVTDLYTRHDVSFSLEQGKTYPITFSTVRGIYLADADVNRVRVWADWNGDSEFSDNELIVSKLVRYTDYDENDIFIFTESLVVPLNARTGTKIGFRVMGHYVDGQGGETACDAINRGNIIDYALRIEEGDGSVPLIADVAPVPNTHPLTEPLQYTDRSSGLHPITSWTWTFQGGEPATHEGQNPPPVRYESAGRHEYSLTVTDQKGNTDTYTNYITSQITYCNLNVSFGGYFNVTHLVIGDVWDGDVPTSRVTDLYTGYGVFFSLEQGKTYPITFSTVRGIYLADADVNRVRVWADWNGDSEFSDNELIVSKLVRYTDYDENDIFIFTDSLVVPLNARTGTKIGFRVMGHYVDDQGEGETACDAINSGNIIDYALRIEEGDGSVPLIADVAPVPNTHPLTEPLQYTDRSSGLHPITSWTWTFQGGEPATHEGQNPPPVRYESAKRYEYSLTVTDQEGNTDTYTNYVNVEEGDQSVPLIADVAPVPNPHPLTEPLQYTDQSSGPHPITNYVWTFQGGEPATHEGQNPPPVRYESAKRYEYSLTVTDQEGNTDTYTNYVNVEEGDQSVPLIADVAPVPNPHPLTEPLQYTDQSSGSHPITNYVWTFQGGEPATHEGQNPPPVRYESAKRYEYSLTVTDQEGNTDTYTNYVNVEEGDGSVPLIADVAPVPNTHPLTEPLQYTDRSSGLHPITSWTWTFQGGEPATHEGQNPPPVRYESAGRHEYSLTVTDQKGNTDTYTNYITFQNNYCRPFISYGSHFNVTHLVIGDVWDGDVPTSRVTDLYTRHDVSFSLEQGKTYPITFSTVRGIYLADADVNRVRVWADWNGDSEFSDNELIVSKLVRYTDYDENDIFIFTESLVVPLNARTGTKIGFRVMGHYVDDQGEGETACDAINSGNIIDYALRIEEGDGSVPLIADVAPVPNTHPLTEPLQYTDRSSGLHPITSWTWTFQGGEPATHEGQNPPPVRYESAGRHEYSLTVTDQKGNTDTYTNYITFQNNYCRPFISYGSHFNVTHLVIGDVWDGDVPTSRVTDLYTRHDVSFSLEQGKTYPITFSTVRGIYLADADVNRVRVWADWNGDSEFSDNELIVSKLVRYTDYDENDIFIFTESLVVPLNARTGTKIGFRVMGHYVDDQGEGETACDAINRGNIIDYALRIEEGDGSVPLIADVAPVPNTHPLTEPLQYTDRSSGLHPITSWTWTFQGGEPATHEGQNPPPVRYESAGRHEYSLTVTDQKGNTDTYTNYITFQNNYCRPFISYGSHFNVTHLVIGDVWDGDVPTSRVTDLYTGYGVFFSLEQGKTYPITFSTVRGIYLADADVNRVRVWADWNGDSEFSDNELIVSKLVRYTDYDENDIFIFTESLVVPLNARTGTKIGFRVMGHYVDDQGEGETACDAINSGNIIDYALRIEEGDGSVPLIADVAPVPNPHPLTEPLQYTDQSSGPHPITNYVWTFQGGEPATHEGQNPPPVRYESAKRYEYSLTVTDQEGNTDTYTNYVNVEEGDQSVPLIADVALVSNPHPLTEPLQYTDQSSGSHPITNYVWTFQGGEPATHEGQNPPPVRYESAKRYEYSLTVTDQEDNTDTYTNYVNVEEGDASIVTATSLVEKNLTKIQLYPNPIDREMFVTGENPLHVVIWNITGSLVGTHQMETHNLIDFTAYPRGVYIIKIKDGKGNIEIKKVIRK